MLFRELTIGFIWLDLVVLVKYETGHNLALGCSLLEQLLIRHIQSKRGVQRTFRTDIDTLQAENTLGREDSLPVLGIVGDADIHRADLRARTTLVALVSVAGDFEQREPAGNLEQRRNRTYILAEGAIILEKIGQRDAGCKVEQITAKQPVELGHTVPFHAVAQAQAKHHHAQTQCKVDIA